MKGAVKIMGSPMNKDPKIETEAVIEGQGKIPYCIKEDVKTPNASEAISMTGKKRGMGSALRGGRYTYN
jgi:hypothetical protein